MTPKEECEQLVQEAREFIQQANNDHDSGHVSADVISNSALGEAHCAPETLKLMIAFAKEVKAEFDRLQEDAAKASGTAGEVPGK